MADGAGRGWRPSCVPEDTPDWCCVPPPEEPDYDPGTVLDEIIARADSGEIEIPPDAGPEDVPCFRGPMVVLGEPADLTAADLAGGAFRQGGRAAALPPGPALGALTGSAAADPRSLTDDELLGQIIEARRLQAHYEWEEYRGIAEFARRQEEAYKASTDKGDRALRRQGEFGSEELGFALGMSSRSAGTLIDLAYPGRLR